ncbi:unnamed protein product [Malus baccata var. baccata]
MATQTTLPLNGRVAIVTGGSRGIGRAITTQLHSAGARLNHETTQLRAIAVRADVSDPDQVKQIFEKSEEEFGSQVHIVVNCAGVLDPKYPSLANTIVEEWDNTFNHSLLLVSREAAKRLAPGGGGRIIMITTSLVGALMPGYAAFAASKAAVEMMAKILAKELKGTAITVNCIAPGPVATELFFAGKSEETIKRIEDASPLGRLGEPKDVSQLVGFLAGDAGELVNGQVIRVNGGFVI